MRLGTRKPPRRKPAERDPQPEVAEPQAPPILCFHDIVERISDGIVSERLAATLQDKSKVSTATNKFRGTILRYAPYSEKVLDPIQAWYLTRTLLSGIRFEDDVAKCSSAFIEKTHLAHIKSYLRVIATAPEFQEGNPARPKSNGRPRKTPTNRIVASFKMQTSANPGLRQ
jgi:hypothetical protein